MQKFFLLSLLLTLFLFSCKDDNPFPTSEKFFQGKVDTTGIRIKTIGVTNISNTSATVGIEISGLQAGENLTAGIELGIDGQALTAHTAGGYVNGYREIALSNLTPSTKYNVNATMKYHSLTIKGKVLDFTTLAAPAISISGNLQFGNMIVGGNMARSIVIQNTGGSPAIVNSLSLPSGYTSDWTSGTIAAGATQNVQITFAPTQVASYQGNLTLTYNTNQTYTAAVSGNGISNPNGNVLFWIKNDLGCGFVTVTITATGHTGQITGYYSSGPPPCGSAACANFTMPVGTYAFTATCGSKQWSGNVIASSGGCYTMRLY